MHRTVLLIAVTILFSPFTVAAEHISFTKIPTTREELSVAKMLEGLVFAHRGYTSLRNYYTPYAVYHLSTAFSEYPLLEGIGKIITYLESEGDGIFTHNHVLRGAEITISPDGQQAMVRGRMAYRIATIWDEHRGYTRNVEVIWLLGKEPDDTWKISHQEVRDLDY